MPPQRPLPSPQTKGGAPPNVNLVVGGGESRQRHFAAATLWPLNIKRFTYFTSELCWRAPRPDLEGYLAPLVMSDEQTAQDFESSYKTAHENGDPGAIMEFAKDNREAIGREWVIRQLLEWRLTGTRDSHRQFARFIGHYWNDKGKRSQPKMLEIMKKDQAVYRDSLTWTKGPMISGLAKRHTIGSNDVKDILKAYRAAYDKWKRSRSARVYLSLMPSR